MSYSDLLRDPRWQRKRLEVMQRADFKCEACGDSRTTLNVHHDRYVRGRMPWDYGASELFCLCEECHARQHGIQTVKARRAAEHEAVRAKRRAETRARAEYLMTDEQREIAVQIEDVDRRIKQTPIDGLRPLWEEKSALLEKARHFPPHFHLWLRMGRSL